jgi:peptide/nickel transport system substrate-binding protein
LRGFYLIFKSFTKTERRIFWSAFIIFAAASTFWLFSFYYRQTIEIPVASRQYIEGIVGQPIFINPIISGTNDADRDLSEIVFSDLLDLTDRYEIKDGGKIWNLFLKPDLLWDDNEPLTSDDVIFTIETIQDPESRSYLAPAWQGVIVNRVSELGIEFTLRTPYAFFLDNLKDLKIIPKHIFETIPTANLRLSNYNLEPVGNGPYKFVSFNKRKDGFITEYKFEINKNYALRTPFLKSLTIKFFPNTSELIRAFNLKKIDGFGDLNPKNINDLKLEHQILEINLPRYYAIFFNTNSHEALKNLTVRTALESAINKKKIVETVFNNKALIIDQPLPPIIPGYLPDTKRLATPDLAKINDLLNKEQWRLNENQIREKKIGKNTIQLEFNIVVPQIPFLEETVNIIKEDWRAIGVKLNLIILNPQDVINEVIKTRNYQMLIFGNILKLNPDIFSFWHSSERFYPGLNLALYENKKADNLLEAIRKNFDAESRKEQLAQLQTLISQDRPAIFLFSPTYLYVSPKNLRGFEEKTLATPSDRFENINKWYLKTARAFK